jgi:hypothetical protein
LLPSWFCDDLPATVDVAVVVWIGMMASLSLNGAVQTLWLEALVAGSQSEFVGDWKIKAARFGRLGERKLATMNCWYQDLTS